MHAFISRPYVWSADRRCARDGYSAYCLMCRIDVIVAAIMRAGLRSSECRLYEHASPAARQATHKHNTASQHLRGRPACRAHSFGGKTELLDENYLPKFLT